MCTGAVSRYKLTTEPGLSHGAGVWLRALVRRQGLRFKRVCHEGTVCKNRDKQMYFSTYDKSIVSGTISITLVNYCS